MKTAILLLGFNRVEYFDQTLKSLEKNSAAYECDIHIYLDGGEKSRQEELVALVEKSKFTDVNFVLRPDNWGIGRHLIDARRTLFDELNYDRLILLEDDMLLAPNYIQTVVDMMDWTSKYCDVGTVMAYNLNTDPTTLQEEQMSDVIATNRHFWGYGMTRQVWDIIKPIIYDFEQKYLLKNAYADRSHFRIRWSFMRSYMSKKRRQRTGKNLIPKECLAPPFPKIPRKSPTSQDAITALALWYHGFGRVTTRVSRAEYIGVEGFHTNQELYTTMGFQEQNILDISTFKEEKLDYVLATKDASGNTLKPAYYR